MSFFGSTDKILADHAVNIENYGRQEDKLRNILEADLLPVYKKLSRTKHQMQLDICLLIEWDFRKKIDAHSFRIYRYLEQELRDD